MTEVEKIVEEKNNKLSLVGKSQIYCYNNDMICIDLANVNYKNLVIPNFVRGIINRNQDYNNFIIESIEFSESIEFIGYRAFSNLRNLRKVSNLCSVKSVSMYMLFNNCGSLKIAPLLPNFIDNIECTFYNCSSLEEVKIPDEVTQINFAFANCTALKNPPILPSKLINMRSAFNNCISLIKAPVITENVKDMTCSFHLCKMLKYAPDIAEKVEDMYCTFGECISLIKAPIIPENVKDIEETFYHCESLTGDLIINTNTENYGNCLDEASTSDDTKLVLKGSSKNLSRIIRTKSENSNITLG